MFKSWYSNFYNQFSKLNQPPPPISPNNPNSCGGSNGGVIPSIASSSPQSMDCKPKIQTIPTISNNHNHPKQHQQSSHNTEFISQEKISLASPRLPLKPKSPQIITTSTNTTTATTNNGTNINNNYHNNNHHHHPHQNTPINNNPKIHLHPHPHPHLGHPASFKIIPPSNNSSNNTLTLPTKLTRSPSSSSSACSSPKAAPGAAGNGGGSGAAVNLHRNKSALNKSSSLSPKKISNCRKFINNTDLNSNKCSLVAGASLNSSNGGGGGGGCVIINGNTASAAAAASHNLPSVVSSSSSNSAAAAAANAAAAAAAANLIDYSNLFFNTFQSLVHYGDNIGAKIVKCLINENLYESQSLINQDYDIYQVGSILIWDYYRGRKKFQ